MATEPDTAAEPPAAGRRGEKRGRRRRLLRPLPVWIRLGLFLAGWFMVLLGIAGLVLPGPGVLTIVIGAAVLSLVSELAYDLLRWSFGRTWPSGWRRVIKLRQRIHRWVHPGGGDSH